jgi:beta-glucosidase/6-phospho-beta-glucosidase/beta-galactosidase
MNRDGVIKDAYRIAFYEEHLPLPRKAVDFAAQTRAVKKSGYWHKALAKNNGV